MVQMMFSLKYVIFICIYLSVCIYNNNNNNLFVKQYNTCTYIIADSNSYKSANHQHRTYIHTYRLVGITKYIHCLSYT